MALCLLTWKQDSIGGPIYLSDRNQSGIELCMQSIKEHMEPVACRLLLECRALRGSPHQAVLQPGMNTADHT